MASSTNETALEDKSYETYRGRPYTRCCSDRKTSLYLVFAKQIPESDVDVRNDAHTGERMRVNFKVRLQFGGHYVTSRVLRFPVIVTDRVVHQRISIILA